MDFHHIDTSKSLIQLLVLSVGELLHDKSCQTYIIMYRALSKATPYTIFYLAATLAYKALQNFITEDYVWRMLVCVLCKHAPHLGVKV